MPQIMDEYLHLSWIAIRDSIAREPCVVLFHIISSFMGFNTIRTMAVSQNVSSFLVDFNTNKTMILFHIVGSLMGGFNRNRAMVLFFIIRSFICTFSTNRIGYLHKHSDQTQQISKFASIYRTTT